MMGSYLFRATRFFFDDRIFSSAHPFEELEDEDDDDEDDDDEEEEEDC